MADGSERLDIRLATIEKRLTDVTCGMSNLFVVCVY